MNLTGELHVRTVADTSISRLHIDNNRISADSSYRDYKLTHDLNELSVADNPLSRAFSLDTKLIPRVNISGTNASYCYDGPSFVSPLLEVLSIRRVRPQPTCNRASEQAIPLQVFSACSEIDTSGGGPAADPLLALNHTMCWDRDSKVFFSDRRLTCPSWSTVLTGGTAVLDVDAAFLGFWGCTCPIGYYWGYARNDTTLSDETRQLHQHADMSLGEREALLLRRTCLPCPPELPIRCSALAVVSAPHVVTRSVYPFMPDGARNRSLLPYLESNSLRSCLHPEVCGAGDRYKFNDLDWPKWVALSATGEALSQAFSDVQCREGHDPTTPLCAGCLRGYWLDGFLCQRCFFGAEALVVLALVGGLALLVYAVWRHHRPVDRKAADHYLTLILWFFQVTQTLQVSSQINAAQRDTASATASAGDGADTGPGSGLSRHLSVLSFRPWAMECLYASWTLKVASVALFGLPWVVGVAALVVPRWRRACVLLLDLMYLPVAERAILWFNTMKLPRDQDNVSAPPLPPLLLLRTAHADPKGSADARLAVCAAALAQHGLRRPHDCYGGPNVQCIHRGILPRHLAAGLV
jgi:hypothetical protein